MKSKTPKNILLLKRWPIAGIYPTIVKNIAAIAIGYQGVCIITDE